jgi:hypothetical protein
MCCRICRVIKLVTFVAHAEPEPDVESEQVLRETDHIPVFTSPPLFPKDSFYLLCFFVTVGNTGTG